MRTAAQIAASRRNALRSTGPRTAAGKAICRRNALKHGLRANTPLPPAPDVVAGLTEDFHPTTESQTAAILTVAIAVARWRIVEELTRQFLDSAFAGELDVNQVVTRWITLDRYDSRMNLALHRALNSLWGA